MSGTSWKSIITRIMILLGMATVTVIAVAVSWEDARTILVGLALVVMGVFCLSLCAGTLNAPQDKARGPCVMGTNRVQSWRPGGFENLRTSGCIV